MCSFKCRLLELEPERPSEAIELNLYFGAEESGACGAHGLLKVTLESALEPESPRADVYCFCAKHLVTLFYQLHPDFALGKTPFLDP